MVDVVDDEPASTFIEVRKSRRVAGWRASSGDRSSSRERCGAMRKSLEYTIIIRETSVTDGTIRAYMI